MLVMVKAVSAGSAHTVGRVSLQPDGSISVGLAGRVFMVPHSPEELRPVTDPH
jgi:hypothetical protein